MITTQLKLIANLKWAKALPRSYTCDKSTKRCPTTLVTDSGGANQRHKETLLHTKLAIIKKY